MDPFEKLRAIPPAERRRARFDAIPAREEEKLLDLLEGLIGVVSGTVSTSTVAVLAAVEFLEDVSFTSEPSANDEKRPQALTRTVKEQQEVAYPEAEASNARLEADLGTGLLPAEQKVAEKDLRNLADSSPAGSPLDGVSPKQKDVLALDDKKLWARSVRSRKEHL